ncbi:hypothetical protein D1007_62381 [Hordeum vulgare]|nr:hypothetical protein D1007_62381 [Hordeum vulgare]
MALKTSRGKGATSDKELARLRKKHAFFPKGLDMATLKSRYQIMWAVETKAHPAIEVLPGTGRGGPDQFPFIADYFFCGLCSPFSEFSLDLVHTYGFRVLDFTPTVVKCMSIFAHLCENFVGITPNTSLFGHYFAPRIQGGEALSGSIAWVPRAGTKEAYLGDPFLVEEMNVDVVVTVVAREGVAEASDAMAREGAHEDHEQEKDFHEPVEGPVEGPGASANDSAPARGGETA